MPDRLLDWLAFRLMDVAAWVDRRVWTQYHIWKTIPDEDNPGWGYDVCRRVDEATMLFAQLVGWRWDGWKPARYV